jgi:hypothetical protein
VSVHFKLEPCAGAAVSVGAPLVCLGKDLCGVLADGPGGGGKHKFNRVVSAGRLGSCTVLWVSQKYSLANTSAASFVGPAITACCERGLPYVMSLVLVGLCSSRRAAFQKPGAALLQSPLALNQGTDVHKAASAWSVQIL